MSGSNPRSSSRFAVLRSYISQQNLRAVVSRRTLKPGERGYVDGQTTMQSWSQWASQKIKRSGSGVKTMEEVTLFPGWASKRHNHEHEHESEQVSYYFNFVRFQGLLFLDAFLDVFVSGYATTRRPPELLTRSQRTFLRLAKGMLICKHVFNRLTKDMT